MHASGRSQISPTVFSVALLVYAAICFGGAGAWYVHRNSKDGWSETPAAWMIPLLASPILCSVIGLALVYSRHRLGNRLTWIDWCALVTGGVAVGFGGWLLIIVLGSMRASGVL